MMNVVLGLHAAAGTVALLSMVVPIVTRKGGRTHRRAGWVFVLGMAAVSVTAVPLAAARVLTDPRPDAWAFAMFLLYVAVLTGAGVSTGVRVLRLRQAKSGPAWWDLGLSSLLVGTAVVMAAFGVATGRPLFTAFSVIGLLSGGGQLAYWRRAPSDPMRWWFEHMGNMLGSCIAAATAFLVVNAGRLGAPSDSLVLWLAPSVVGAPAIAIWTAYYRRRFATGRRGSRGISKSAPAAAPYTPSRTG